MTKVYIIELFNTEDDFSSIHKVFSIKDKARGYLLSRGFSKMEGWLDCYQDNQSRYRYQIHERTLE